MTEQHQRDFEQQAKLNRMTTPNAKPRAGEHTDDWTPTPWRLHTNFADTVSAGPFGEKSAIARCEPNGSASENARRIVACVNACEGISQEWLERDGRRIVEAAKERTRLEAERDTLAAQNGELVAMLKQFVFVFGGSKIQSPSIEKARALLAKVRP